MIRSHKHIVNPEFQDLEKYVWECLNRIGRSISEIERNEKKSVLDSPQHMQYRDKPIWHTKEEIDEYVAMELRLKLDDYGKRKSSNSLYKAIANAIGDLRRYGILVDWKKIHSRNTGMGVWMLDKTKLEKFVLDKTKKEIEIENFRAIGSEFTIHARYKQRAFRETLFSEYKKCSLCGFEIPEYLIGAHIVPYSVMREKDADNAMNPSNGLLLCRFCDVAFENGSIRIMRDLGVIINDVLREHESQIVRSWLEPIPVELRIRKNAKYPPNPKYFGWKINLLEGKV
ncbi:MAG: HNH endonuclease [Cenarchaeum symbiont of Oopsacas minuta]|nr:HNH endonuclease [Cenarchaeum symbiont of Oopsacas minuta]